MKLWTKELEKRAKNFPIYSQEKKGLSAQVLVKIFNPYGRGTWLITEAQKQEDGDWLLFGYCHMTEWEWCYLMLSDLENMEIAIFGHRFKLERDLHVSKDATVKDLVK